MPSFLFDGKLFHISGQALERLPAMASWWKSRRDETPPGYVIELGIHLPFLQHVDYYEKMQSLINWAENDNKRWGLIIFPKDELEELAMEMCKEEGSNPDLATVAFSPELDKWRTLQEWIFLAVLVLMTAIVVAVCFILPELFPEYYGRPYPPTGLLTPLKQYYLFHDE
jgi:hypothetical protein